MKEKRTDLGLGHAFKWIQGYVRPYGWWVLASVAASILLVMFNIAKAYYIKELIQDALGGNIDKISASIIMMLGAVLLAIAAKFMSEYAVGRFGIFSLRDIKNDLISKMIKIPVPHLERYQSGDIISRVNTELRTVENFINRGFTSVIFQPLMFITASVFMININWKLYLASYGLLPIIVIIINFLSKKSASYSKDYYEKNSEVNGKIKEYIDGIVTIKSYNLGQYFDLRLKDAFDKVLKSVLKSERVDAFSLPFYFMNYQLSKIICLLLGGFMAIEGQISLGELIAYTQLVSYVSSPASAMMGLVANLRKTSVAINRLREFADLQSEDERQGMGGAGLEKVTDNNSIEFSKVSFGYTSDKHVLRDMDFKLPKTGLVAMVGVSGEGKTTIMNLIAGFYDVDDGEIQVLGTDIKTWDLPKLRSKISYVTQDSYLFPGTIYENIGYGKKGASIGEIMDAAKQAGAHDFIMSLPQGYETVVGERGNNLSGGQVQRLSIARAVLKNSPILLLDEPTSALDSQSEKIITKTLMKLSKDSLVLVSAHRLSTIVKADNILVVEGGKIAEQGDHNQLMKNQSNIYYKLYQCQFNDNDGIKEVS